MAAFNWINVEARCPACGNEAQIRCQTHVASDYGGDATGRFHDRNYVLGQTMAWWPREDERHAAWRVDHHRAQLADMLVDEEACYATCGSCDVSLYVVIQFRLTTPERVLAIGREDDWPDEYLR